MLLKKTIDSNQINRAIASLADQIAQAHPLASEIVLAGIADGGLPLCQVLSEELSKKLGSPISQGIVDISFHRDDIGHKPITKEVRPTHIDADPEDVVIILVDDVLFSGRTVRAAMAEVHSLGRPRAVELAVLVDRGNRKLPIAANYVGLVEETAEADIVVVEVDPSNPANSKIDIQESN